MKLHLEDKVVLITGAAKGMGPAIAGAFAAEKCRIVMVGRDMAAIQVAAQRLVDEGVEVLMIRCDVTDASDTSAVAERATSTFGRVDVLVNVAGGTGPIGLPTWQTSQADLEQVLQLNLTGCFNTMKAVMPGMIERAYGKIINVGGTFGMRGRAGRMAYSASKWGLRGLTKSAALEAGPHNINVNCIAPGMVDGPRFRTKVVPQIMQQRGISANEALESLASEYALRRISTDTDVANGCLFLASDVSRQITGIDLPVDGGWAML
jgi:NAD(P)-dependent dehydrogenase (short-subunit alcohol dehydrogenase family)